MTDIPSPDQAPSAFVRELTEVVRPTPRRLSMLARDLTVSADEEGLIAIAYTTVDTPVGSLLLCATTTGLLRVAFDVEGHREVLDRLADAVSPLILRNPKRLDPVMRELDDYFAGRRRSFDVPLDRRLSKGFQRTVLEHLPDIPYGATATYASVAAASGSPRAVRAVGTACATNPLPVVVPCHRVVRSDGTDGRYRGGEAAKRVLLDLEATA
ncbi:methylated-DNA--[protein]-cysteine S-methyltransferase [Frigoribacterium sp. 2-23]|uniref:methylated-DNA--[protein]-cysteine S-methyltransferase n=1 Tax=Frigoribacterium sp. 2-23 TaxID=3415006 RepID=UPI003C6F917C